MSVLTTGSKALVPLIRKIARAFPEFRSRIGYDRALRGRTATGAKGGRTSQRAEDAEFEDIIDELESLGTSSDPLVKLPVNRVGRGGRTVQDAEFEVLGDTAKGLEQEYLEKASKLFSNWWPPGKSSQELSDEVLRELYSKRVGLEQKYLRRLNRLFSDAPTGRKNKVLKDMELNYKPGDGVEDIKLNYKFKATAPWKKPSELAKERKEVADALKSSKSRKAAKVAALGLAGAGTYGLLSSLLSGEDEGVGETVVPTVRAVPPDRDIRPVRDVSPDDGDDRGIRATPLDQEGVDLETAIEAFHSGGGDDEMTEEDVANAPSWLRNALAGLGAFTGYKRGGLAGGLMGGAGGYGLGELLQQNPGAYDWIKKHPEMAAMGGMLGMNALGLDKGWGGGADIPEYQGYTPLTYENLGGYAPSTGVPQMQRGGVSGQGQELTPGGQKLGAIDPQTWELLAKHEKFNLSPARRLLEREDKYDFSVGRPGILDNQRLEEFYRRKSGLEEFGDFDAAKIDSLLQSEFRPSTLEDAQLRDRIPGISDSTRNVWTEEIGRNFYEDQSELAEYLKSIGSIASEYPLNKAQRIDPRFKGLGGWTGSVPQMQSGGISGGEGGLSSLRTGLRDAIVNSIDDPNRQGVNSFVPSMLKAYDEIPKLQAGATVGSNSPGGVTKDQYKQGGVGQTPGGTPQFQMNPSTSLYNDPNYDKTYTNRNTQYLDNPNAVGYGDTSQMTNSSGVPGVPGGVQGSVTTGGGAGSSAIVEPPGSQPPGSQPPGVPGIGTGYDPMTAAIGQNVLEQRAAMGGLGSNMTDISLARGMAPHMAGMQNQYYNQQMGMQRFNQQERENQARYGLQRAALENQAGSNPYMSRMYRSYA